MTHLQRNNTTEMIIGMISLNPDQIKALSDKIELLEKQEKVSKQSAHQETKQVYQKMFSQQPKLQQQNHSQCHQIHQPQMRKMHR